MLKKAVKPFHLLPQYEPCPQAEQLMRRRDTANVLCCWKPRDAPWRTRWRPHDCPQAGRPSLPRQPLSVGRFCLPRGHAQLPVQVMCSSLHVRQHMTARLTLVPSLGRGKQSHLLLGTISCSSSVLKKMLVWPLVSFSSFLPLACLFLHSSRKSRAVSQRVGVFGLGQGFQCFKTPTLLWGTLIPNPRTVLLNAHRQSWTNADTRSCYSSTHFMAVFTRARGEGGGIPICWTSCLRRQI